MIKRLLLSSALFSAQIFGWGSSEYQVPPLQTIAKVPSSESFPLNADQAWFVKPSLLVWRPYQDDIDTGYTIATPSTVPVLSKDKTQNVDFEWNTGVRLTIGRYLPKHEQWDVTLASTFYYSDTDQNIKSKDFPNPAGTLANTTVITEGWNPSLLGIGIETDLSWRINYFTWDLAAGRLYQLTPKLVIHPYLCLRSMLIYEKYQDKNRSAALDEESNYVVRNTKFSATQSIWGVGPRLGSDVMFSFGHGWSIMGGLSGSVVMGRYNMQQKIDGFILVPSDNPTVDASLRIQDADTVMHANIEGNIGLGWEKWVKNKTVRIAPSFIFEATQWFLINNWVATNLPNTTPSNPDWGMLSSRRMGDLGLLGFTLNLQIDF